jgi:hypothetical protein
MRARSGEAPVNFDCDTSRRGTDFAFQQAPKNAKTPRLFTSMLRLHESQVGRRLGCNLRCSVVLRVLAIQHG